MRTRPLSTSHDFLFSVQPNNLPKRPSRRHRLTPPDQIQRTDKSDSVHIMLFACLFCFILFCFLNASCLESDQEMLPKNQESKLP